MRRYVAMTLLVVLLIAACLILTLSNIGYASQDRDAILAGTSFRHWAGTDALGRDQAVRVAAALLIALFGAGLAAVITTTLAACVGMIAAFSHPVAAAVLLFVCDIFLTLPWIFLLMMVRAGLPLTMLPAQSAAVTFIILAALGWPACAQAVYRGALRLRNTEWMIQARAGGLRTRQMLRHHLLPNLRSLLVPQFLICVPAFIVAEANLGTLGLGIAEPLPSWGSMLQQLSSSALVGTSHWIYLPIVLLVIILILLESITLEA